MTQNIQYCSTEKSLKVSFIKLLKFVNHNIRAAHTQNNELLLKEALLPLLSKRGLKVWLVIQAEQVLQELR